MSNQIKSNSEPRDNENTDEAADNAAAHAARKGPENHETPEQAAEITSANQELDRELGNEPEGGEIDTNGDNIQIHSIDEHAPTGAESAEDKAMDIINSGVLRG